MKKDTKKQQKQWSEMSKLEKIITIVVAVVFLIIFISIVSALTGSKPDENKSDSNTKDTPSVVQQEKTEKQKALESVTALFATKEAFDTGSYVKGDIPVGEYIFMPFDGSGKYYSEEDGAGNIIDNENFDSFGYVSVRGAGNVKTQGALIKVESLAKTGSTTAKSLYERINDKTDYKDAAIYKIGVDLPAGPYTIESYGQGYVEIMSGPVGNNGIVDNENFSGKFSVNVQSGQYLKVSGGKIL